MGFSLPGLIVSLAVLAPNLLLVRFPPRTPLPRVRVPRPLTWLERTGQALCMVVPAVTAPGPLAWWWCAPGGAGLVGYYALWARYLRTGRVVASLYLPYWRLPVPMAVLPVVVVLASAGWLQNPWVAIAGLVLAVGHVPASMIIARDVSATR